MHPNMSGVDILVDPTPIRLMTPQDEPGWGQGSAAAPPPPGNLQDVRIFPVPGEDANLRVAMIDGEPWFVAADVAAMLGYRDAANAVRIIKERERGTHSVSTPGGLQKVVIISESGFYRLVMRSNRPEADAFQTWVTAEVLPQIRKTGAYTVPRELGRKELARMVIEAEEARERVERELGEAEQRAEGWALTAAKRSAEVAALRPDAELFGLYLNTDGTKPVGVVAQELGLGQTRLFEFLREQKVLIGTPGARFNTPYQQHLETGRFRVKAGVRPSNSEGEKPTYTAVVTPKGEAFIARLVKEKGTDAMRKAMEKVTVTRGDGRQVTGR